jgi:hypothetical protein
MKKSLIAAAAFAALTLGGASLASAGVANTSLAGISTHTNTQLAEQVGYKKHPHHYKHRRHWKKNWWHKKRWVCNWRHGRKHCWWR